MFDTDLMELLGKYLILVPPTWSPSFPGQFPRLPLFVLVGLCVTCKHGKEVGGESESAGSISRRLGLYFMVPTCRVGMSWSGVT